MVQRWMLAILLGALVPNSGFAKVAADVVAQYEKVLAGKAVILAADVKLIKVTKQVRGDQSRGGTGGENLEQTKDGTIVTAKGVEYASEAHSREWLYAPKGASVTIEAVEFGRSAVELEVKSQSQTDSTVITFQFEDKLDESFSARETFRQMLAKIFLGDFVPQEAPKP